MKVRKSIAAEGAAVVLGTTEARLTGGGMVCAARTSRLLPIKISGQAGHCSWLPMAVGWTGTAPRGSSAGPPAAPG